VYFLTTIYGHQFNVVENSITTIKILDLVIKLRNWWIYLPFEVISIYCASMIGAISTRQEVRRWESRSQEANK
jgi:NADH-quinone oxidoreductase subunit J